MSNLFQDLRFGARVLRRSPGYTAIAVLTLALGIGGTTAFFTFADAVLLKPLPYPDADRIVSVAQKRPNGQGFAVTTLDLLDWQEQSRSFEFLGAGRGERFSVARGGAEPQLLNAARVSASYFAVSRTPPLLGRTFTADEEQPGRDRVVILSHVLWQRDFGGDPAVLGRTLTVNNEPHTIVGVMPAGTMFDRSYAEIWKPLAFTPFERSRGLHWLQVYGRLKPGVTLTQAREEMDRLGAQYAQMYPATNNGFGVLVERFSDVIVAASLRTQIYVLFAAAAMVLLIGCANLANLALARGLARSREVAVRAAIGAGRWDLVRQFLTENLLLAAIGGVLALGVGYAVMTWLKTSIPPLSLPAEADLRFDGRVILFAAGSSIVTGLLFGVVPALQVTRPDLAVAMKDGGHGAAGSSRSRLRGTLVVAEVALAFVLLAGAGLLLQTLFTLRRVQTAAASGNVLAVVLPTPAPAYMDDMARFRVYLGEIERVVAQVPGVRQVAFGQGVPLRPGGFRIPMQRADTEPIVRPRRPLFYFRAVTPSYFSTLGVQLREGRLLDDTDRAGGRQVVVVNERLARQLWPGQSAIGQRILVPEILPGKIDLGDDIAWEIVGVIADEKLLALKDDTTGMVYATVDQRPMLSPNLVVRTAGDPLAAVTAIRHAIDTVNKDQAMADVRTLDQLKAESLITDRVQTTVVSVFSTLALLLAALGIYGVISHSVTQRLNELAVRAALGATGGRLLWLALHRGLMLATIGLLLGAAGAVGLMRGMGTMLYGVTPRDPATLAAVAATLFGVALLACMIPARRALRIDPATMLRGR